VLRGCLSRRLMGRAASHVTLECALQTHPQLALVCEEVAAHRWGLKDVVRQAGLPASPRARAAALWMHYGFTSARAAESSCTVMRACRDGPSLAPLCPRRLPTWSLSGRSWARTLAWC
jgi:hypothetical protein